MDNNELLKKIEIKRAELIDIVHAQGLRSTTAIHYSQELDSLLNEYHRLLDTGKLNKQRRKVFVCFSETNRC
ncbi:aspartyl-phosphate phosphatase Spo0E family protein [Bacillus chungangensis]|uniref:Aspartyl-phosphate phosphatase Spo0E family protein n=1 Tax=Bacillus chungangensis TaxID=587633 RepID=A0ABT9WZ03_9BACI|nr:aspartyl-phosphate phosphatase Spo0E family protein [Bacillus chungangensis]MDQ0178513.1 hypothetical protein [Bacillus chungangensis]